MKNKRAKKGTKRRKFVANPVDNRAYPITYPISGYYKKLDERKYSYNITVRDGNGQGDTTIEISYNGHSVAYDGSDTRFVKNGRETKKPDPHLLLMEALAKHFYKQIDNNNIPNQYTVRISKIGEVHRVSAPRGSVAQPSPSLGGRRKKRNPSEEIANKLSSANLYALDPTTYGILEEYKQYNPEQNAQKVMKILEWLNCIWNFGNGKYVIVTE